jgi:hypothetical protein
MRSTDQLVLDAIAGRRPTQNNKIRANCPHCETTVGKVDRKSCLELDITTGWWKCYRCDQHGRLDVVPFDTTTLPTVDKDAPRAPVDMPEGFLALWRLEGKASVAAAPARKYLAKRVGITDRVVKLARIGACVRGPFAQRVVVPIYKGGKLVGYVGRTWRKKCDMKYLYNTGFERASTVYNEDTLYVTTDAPAIVVEGVFDTFPFWNPREPLSDAVAVLGKTSPDQFDMLCKARRPLLIVFDGDAHRMATALAMQLRLAGKQAAALRLAPGKDPDECVNYVMTQARAAFALGRRTA